MRGIDYWYIRPSIRRPPTGEKQKSCQFFKNLTALYVCGHAEPAAVLPPHGQQRGTGASFRTSPGPEIIPTRSWNIYLKQFGLDDICSGSSEYFDYPYYHSYTTDAYQNLISGDKSQTTYSAIVAGRLSKFIIQQLCQICKGAVSQIIWPRQHMLRSNRDQCFA